MGEGPSQGEGRGQRDEEWRARERSGRRKTGMKDLLIKPHGQLPDLGIMIMRYTK